MNLNSQEKPVLIDPLSIQCEFSTTNDINNMQLIDQSVLILLPRQTTSLVVS